MSASLPVPPAAPPVQAPGTAPTAPAAPAPAPDARAVDRVRLDSLREAARRIEEIPAPTPPVLASLPKAPALTPQESMSALGQWGTILAVLGSAFTREPMATAFNAAAAGMRAYQQGNILAVHEERKTFRDALQRALAHNKMLNEQYVDALQKSGFDLNKARGALTAIATEHRDQIALAAINAANSRALMEVTTQREIAGEKLAIMAESQNYLYREQQLKDVGTLLATGYYTPASAREAVGLPPLKGADHDTGQTSMVLPKSTLATEAFGEILSGKPPSMGRGTQGAWGINRKNYMNTYAALVRALGGPAAVQMIRGNVNGSKIALSRIANLSASVDSFEGTAVRVAALLHQAMKSGLAGSGVVPLNHIIQSARRAGGNPAIARMDTLMETLNSEYARVMSSAAGGGGGATTDAARAAAGRLLSPDMTLPQAAASLHAMLQAMQVRRQAINDELGALRASLLHALPMQTGTVAPGSAQVAPAVPPSAGLPPGFTLLPGGTVH